MHHLIQDVEISCLPADLPEFLELDLSNMNLNDTLYLADIPLPAGVTIPELKHGNPPVVSVHSPRVVEVEAEAAAAGRRCRGGRGAGDGEEAKKDEPKKDEAQEGRGQAPRQEGKK